MVGQENDIVIEALVSLDFFLIIWHLCHAWTMSWSTNVFTLTRTLWKQNNENVGINSSFQWFAFKLSILLYRSNEIGAQRIQISINTRKKDIRWKYLKLHPSKNHIFSYGMFIIKCKREVLYKCGISMSLCQNDLIRKPVKSC